MLRSMSIMMLAFLAISPIKAQEIRSIDEFIAENANNTNGSLEAFIGLRCASLYMVMKAILERNLETALAKKFEVLSNSAMTLVLNSGVKDNKYIVTQTDLMTTAYIEKMKQSEAMTGNKFDNPVVISDEKTCRSIFTK